jgi:hypothetical protein
MAQVVDHLSNQTQDPEFNLVLQIIIIQQQ